jgi:cytochrome c-type biogenesis protein
VAAAEYALAFSAGVISFASPCVLPLVPVYLSVTTGLGVAELSDPGRRTAGAVLRGATLFVLGFSTVFIALGLSATAVGQALLQQQVQITRGAGVLVLLFAVLMLAGTTRAGHLLSREWRFRPGSRTRQRVWASPALGAAFAFGWTPCIGPVLGSILVIASGQDGVLRGGLLLATYSAGLALPLLLTGLVFHRAVGALRWTRRHSLVLTRCGGAVLVGYGLLLVTDQLAWLTRSLQAGLPPAGG